MTTQNTQTGLVAQNQVETQTPLLNGNTNEQANTSITQNFNTFVPIPGNTHGIVTPESFLLIIAECERLFMVNRALYKENEDLLKSKSTLISSTRVTELIKMNEVLNEELRRIKESIAAQPPVPQGNGAVAPVKPKSETKVSAANVEKPNEDWKIKGLEADKERLTKQLKETKDQLSETEKELRTARSQSFKSSSLEKDIERLQASLTRKDEELSTLRTRLSESEAATRDSSRYATENKEIKVRYVLTCCELTRLRQRIAVLEEKVIICENRQCLTHTENRTSATQGSEGRSSVTGTQGGAATGNRTSVTQVSGRNSATQGSEGRTSFVQTTSVPEARTSTENRTSATQGSEGRTSVTGTQVGAATENRTSVTQVSGRNSATQGSEGRTSVTQGTVVPEARTSVTQVSEGRNSATQGSEGRTSVTQGTVVPEARTSTENRTSVTENRTSATQGSEGRTSVTQGTAVPEARTSVTQASEGRNSATQGSEGRTSVNQVAPVEERTSVTQAAAVQSRKSSSSSSASSASDSAAKQATTENTTAAEQFDEVTLIKEEAEPVEVHPAVANAQEIPLEGLQQGLSVQEEQAQEEKEKNVDSAETLIARLAREGEDFQKILEQNNVKSMNLVLAIDCTASNHYSGKESFDGLCMHEISQTALNPYEQVIGLLGPIVEHFDQDQRIPVYLFGDSQSKGKKVRALSTEDKDEAIHGIHQVLDKYRETIPTVDLSGPTSFKPVIERTTKLIKGANKDVFHLLIIIGDGGVTDRKENLIAIKNAADFPLGIIFIGVGDGDTNENAKDPWYKMRELDSNLPGRNFDNFNFVLFKKETPLKEFIAQALHEVPAQYNYCLKNKMIKE